ncbi:hypothetical protein SAMN05518672_104708 [Chitinophaga sp. CF118]|uniref:DUF6934 family protein n=1 Tax=Chitinophaga sp. CF118 TaxID=1884367 RepID=UPI0008EB6EDA|nr:hypothetical protein [Chitinophaga sp. CF118]SFE16040.1 hypothetical protein SAMN05518672_104708 [Chitinophaga sp. CF118]
MSNTNHYLVDSKFEEGKLKYHFESVGKTKVIKVIDYSPLNIEYTKPVYNLGFADYDNERGELSDKSVSNNGDTYKVFNTVLTTIPLFFEEKPDGVILVQGSDSDSAYFDVCMLSCQRKCTDKCRKVGRRIKLYCRFINKYYSILNNDYVFKGGVQNNEGEMVMEDYQIGRFYSSIFVYKRK